MSPLEQKMWEVLSVILMVTAIIGMIVFVILAMIMRDIDNGIIKNNTEKALTKIV